MTAEEQAFIDEYVYLCKKYDMYLWSGEPYFALDLINGNADEAKIREDIIVLNK